MKDDNLPYGITHIQRTRRLSCLVAILLVVAATMLIYHLHLLAALLNIIARKPIPPAERTMSILTTIVLGIYFIAAIGIENIMRIWIYKRFGNLRKGDFIKVRESINTYKLWPTPKVMPVLVTIISKVCPVFLVSVIPVLLFLLLGWNTIQMVAIMVFLLYLTDIIESFYYLSFWDQNMIEYIKPGEFFGIDSFDIYFFPKDQTDSAKVFIEKIRQSL